MNQEKRWKQWMPFCLQGGTVLLTALIEMQFDEGAIMTMG